MTMFHFFNCAILTFGPHFVYYSATPLSEYDTIGTSIKAAAVYLGTALVKLVCLATFLKVSENEAFDPYQHFLCAGWAFADSVLHRLAPLWVGARGLEFTWDYILQGLEANANLVLSISLAALGSLMWLRKNKPKILVPIIYLCAGIVATMPSITRHLKRVHNEDSNVMAGSSYLLIFLWDDGFCSYLRRGLGWHFPEVVGFELFTSVVMAFISWQLFAACQRPSF
ncbi:hypothetical protein Cgig2_021227 [Carnegiea gigantea]|uniref:BOS complex subunit TMEM147 n=1 Tax=Carnegiea gigantea TaxID=171969 RepID=A0A9Q1KVP0_9CARY|nr:hypothetical protein Cgig2_021227 [Carnegiea gigantea]